MIDATLENTTSTITMNQAMLTVSNNTEQAEKGGTSNYPHQTLMGVHSAQFMEFMETIKTTMQIFNSTESVQPSRSAAQQEINLDGIYEFCLKYNAFFFIKAIFFPHLFVFQNKRTFI